LFGLQWLAFGRHADGKILCCDTRQQQACGSVTRDNAGTTVTPAAHEVGSVQTQPGFLPQRSVAGHAAFPQDGTHLLLIQIVSRRSSEVRIPAATCCENEQERGRYVVAAGRTHGRAPAI
jgi:hypothetical protein